MRKIFKQLTPEKIEEVRTHPYYASTVKAIRERAEGYLASEPPRIRFSDIHLFATTGNRTVYQAVYGDYQTRMETYFFMYLLTEDEKYIEPLADIIWNICDMESWSLPAHVAENIAPERRRSWLDLCSTILGWRIAEILYYIGDKLPSLVTSRAKYEVRLRVINSYRIYDDFWWMKATNNWSAVCIGATLGAYLCLAEDSEIEAQIPRMIETAKCYLRGFDDDGCCREGYGYWNYGFSFFCMFADMLRTYTDGEINLFEDEKVHAIALFQQNAVIDDTHLISFSDCGLRFSPCPWLTHFLKREYPDIEIPSFTESPERSAALRNIMWQEPAFANGKMEPKSFIFEQAEWFIFRGKNYNFAIKAGNNNEPHNHNDIGSFLLSRGGEVAFTDPGGGEYTRQYFSSERYTILATSSRGHSVPIINGAYQVTGKARSTVYAQSENEYVFSMENGYAVDSLTSLTRRAKCEDDFVCITDTYKFHDMPASVVERFVSFISPEIGDDYVKCGNSTLRFDPEVFAVSVGTEEFIRHTNMSETLYQIDLTVKAPSTNFSVSVTIG